MMIGSFVVSLHPWAFEPDCRAPEVRPCRTRRNTSRPCAWVTSLSIEGSSPRSSWLRHPLPERYRGPAGRGPPQLGFITSLDSTRHSPGRACYGFSGLGELLPHPAASKLLTEQFLPYPPGAARGLRPTKPLILAMVDPADVVTIDDVRLITGLEVRPVATTAAAITEAWDLVYADQGRSKPTSAGRRHRPRSQSGRPKTTR